MNNTEKHISFTKVTILLFFTFLIITGLYFLKPFLVPLSFAFILAMLMMPVSDKLENSGMPKGVAIFCCILIILFVFILTILVLYEQIEALAHDLPNLKSTVTAKIEQIQIYINDKISLSSEKQRIYMKSRSEAFVETTAARIKSLLIFTTGFIGSFLLTLVYTCLFMAYRERFKKFFLKMFPNGNGSHEALIQKISAVAEQYLLGRLITIILLAILYSIGLLMTGVKYAIFLAILSAILNIVPILGTLFGAALSLLIAFITGDTGTIWGVFAVFVAVQLIENYLLTPLVVGVRVNLNPLFTLMAVMGGSLLWDIPGMILSIPFLAILKIIFDNFTSLEPIGYIMGREVKERKLVAKILKK